MNSANLISRRAMLCCIGAAAVSPALAGSVYTPGRGDPDRKAILNSVRPRIEHETRGAVEFVVRTLNVMDDWAFAVLDPQRPGGRQIRIEDTIHAADADFMDGLTVYALSRRTSGGWRLVESVTGPTDVAYDPWPEIFGAPRAIFGY